MLANMEVPVPNWVQLKEVEDVVASVRSLVVTHENPPILKCKNVLTVPPLVVSSLMASKTTDPEILLLNLLQDIKTYDKDSGDSSVIEKLRSVLEFLWAVASENIIPISFSPDNSGGGRKWSISLHTSIFPNQNIPYCTGISPQDPSNNDVWEKLSDALKILPGIQSKSSLAESAIAEMKEDQTNGWDKIPEVLQQMIIKLSSTNDEGFPSGPVATYLQVLKQSKALGLAMVLNVMLSTMGCQVEITASMANAIKTGNFRANSLLVAHSFSIFNVPYLDAALMTNFNQTELDLLQSEGEGIPKDMVKKPSENKFKSPTTTHLLRHQFNNWYGLFQIIFGAKALTTLEIREWIDHIDKHEMSYDAGFKSDKDFGAKILGLVDLTFFQFCESCLRASSPDDVKFSQILLENKRQEIIQNFFQANKPAYLISSKLPLAESEEDEKDGDKNPRHKRLKKERDGQLGDKDLGKAITNPNPVKEWIVTKNYRKIFHKGVNRFTPAFNSTGDITCNKWHLQGYCFKKFECKNTHRSFTERCTETSLCKVGQGGERQKPTQGVLTVRTGRSKSRLCLQS
jgi:hypothetical protein